MVRRTASLAQQVAQEILSEIETGTLAREGGLLPSETDLSHRFDVSRATVREALSRLDLAGVVIRRQGVGTYVNSRRNGTASVRGWFDDATALMDFVRGSDTGARAQVIECDVRPANGVACYLDIAPTAPVLAIEKLFYTGDNAVIHCVNIVPVSLLATSSATNACCAVRVRRVHLPISGPVLPSPRPSSAERDPSGASGCDDGAAVALRGWGSAAARRRGGVWLGSSAGVLRA